MAYHDRIDAVKSEIDALITYANGVTGESDADIGECVHTLADGYGSGSGNTYKLTKILENSTGDVSFADYLRQHPYPLENQNCTLLFYCYDGDAPTQGSYTLNNFRFVVRNGSLEKASHEYLSGKVSGASFYERNGSGEADRNFKIVNGCLTTSYTVNSSSSCICGVGGNIYALEIPIVLKEA